MSVITRSKFGVILVIDDDPTNIKVAIDALKAHGFNILIARNGEIGVKRAKFSLPDLILLDVMMPGLDGFETCRRLKSDEKTREIPIIFMTALNSVEDKVKGFTLGGVDYVTKPIREDELLARVTTHIHLQHYARELRHAKESAEAAQRLAEQANQAKSRFLANMSHELRTPLNAVLGYAQILSHSTCLAPEEQGHLHIITRSGEHLLALINDVLELAKIDADRIEVQPVSFDLRQMLSDLEAMFRLRAERKGLALRFEYTSDVPPYIRADQNKLRQILINLLGNAVKYTEEGEVILEILDLGFEILDLKEGGQSKICNLQFKISDTGIGIAPADLESVFEAFVRIDEQQFNKGTGLGLPISRKYARMMGGNLTVNSDVDKGSIFCFDMVIEVVDVAEADPMFSAKKVIGVKPGQPNYRLLIVEDNENSRNLTVHVLQSMGFQVREVLNGVEAITLLKTWQPHLIWMDMRMPIMDGYEATREIRRLEVEKLRQICDQKTREGHRGGSEQSQISNPKSQIKIIALTATAFEEDRVKILEAGCDDFVRKPFREAEIFDMLHKHLGVQFVYEEERESILRHAQDTAIEKVLTPEALAALPAERLAALEQGAQETDVKMLREVIALIRRHDAGLADALAYLTDDFEYDQILELIHLTNTLK